MNFYKKNKKIKTDAQTRIQARRYTYTAVLFEDIHQSNHAVKHPSNWKQNILYKGK